MIDRLYDQNVGYWQPDMQGLEHLTRADHAELLVDYLDVSESALVKAVERLTADGKYELAASLLESSGDRFEHSDAVTSAKRTVYLKLMEKHQNMDPFKFIIYSGKIGGKNTADDCDKVKVGLNWKPLMFDGSESRSGHSRRSEEICPVTAKIFIYKMVKARLRRRMEFISKWISGFRSDPSQSVWMEESRKSRTRLTLSQGRFSVDRTRLDTR